MSPTMAAGMPVSLTGLLPALMLRTAGRAPRRRHAGPPRTWPAARLAGAGLAGTASGWGGLGRQRVWLGRAWPATGLAGAGLAGSAVGWAHLAGGALGRQRGPLYRLAHAWLCGPCAEVPVPPAVADAPRAGRRDGGRRGAGRG